MRFKTSVYVLAVAMLVLSLLTDEVDARRKVLRGRKAITREYYKGTAIPAWSIAVIVGLVMIGLGGGFYALMLRIIFKDGGSESAV